MGNGRDSARSYHRGVVTTCKSDGSSIIGCGFRVVSALRGDGGVIR
jgi:hypothetical protein